MKRRFCCLLIIAFALAVLAGCGAPTASPDPAPTPTARTSPDPNVPLPGAKANPNNPGEADKPTEKETAKPEEEKKDDKNGKSWYLLINDAVTGQYDQSGATFPVEAYMAVLMKNLTESEGAKGTFYGSAYFETKIDPNKVLALGKSYYTGAGLNAYHIAQNSEITLSQLGQNADYTQYSGLGTFPFQSLFDASAIMKPDPSFSAIGTDSGFWEAKIIISVLPKTTTEKGLDVTLEIDDTETRRLNLPPFLGKLFSSDEMSEEEYNDMIGQLEDQINKSREEVKKDEGKEEPKDANQQAIETLESNIKSKEDTIKSHENDDQSKYSKKEWEVLEQNYYQDQLELATMKEQLADLRK